MADDPTVELGRDMEEVSGCQVDLFGLSDDDLGPAGQKHTYMVRRALSSSRDSCSVRPSPSSPIAPPSDDAPAERDHFESAVIERHYPIWSVEAPHYR